MRDLRKYLIILFVIISLMLCTLSIMASSEARARARLSAKASALYSVDLDLFLEETKSNVRLPMASTTKIMTALVTLENIDLKKSVKITKDAVGIEGSSVYLKEGDVLSVEDLLYSLLLRSANDAAAALAIAVSGSIDDFCVLMNERASSLGLLDTSFKNPHGLDCEGHYTTAHDLAIIAKEAITNETFRKITSTYKYSFQLGDAERTVVNHNKLLKLYDGAVGVKTGFTKKSGRCLVSAAVRDGVTLIAVTLDAPNDWKDHATLLDSGFERVKRINLSDITDTSFEIPVIGGDKESLICRLDSGYAVYSLDGEDISCKIELPRYVAAPVASGDTIGHITVYKNDTEYKKINISADYKIEKARK